MTVGLIQHIKPRMSTLHHDIMAFCEKHEMAVSRFGLLALNDKAFVSTLPKGRRVWPETEEKVRAFMEGYAPEPAETATA